MSDNLKTWPERIWLQHGDSPDVPNYEECRAAVTWCWHSIERGDVEYVRADRIAELERQNAELQEAVTLRQTAIDGYKDELAELRKDAELLDWLAEQPSATVHHPIDMPNTVSESKSYLIVDYSGDELGRGNTLRAALTQAKKEGSNNG